MNMGKKITVEPVSRVEGHAKITVSLNDAGQVDDAHLHIVEMRGFEKLLQGRPIEDAQRIVTAICGICPVSHHLASAKAADNTFGVEITKLGLEVAAPLFDQYLDVIKMLGVVDTPMMGLVKDGNLELYDGTLRMMDTDGSIIKEFDPTKYADYIQEGYQDWSYLKFPYWKEKGW